MDRILQSGQKYESVSGSKIRNTILNWETDASDDVIYVGHAAKGTPDSYPGWFIEKIVNPAAGGGDGTIRVSAENQIWDNRAALTYT